MTDTGKIVEIRKEHDGALENSQENAGYKRWKGVEWGEMFALVSLGGGGDGGSGGGGLLIVQATC